MPLWGARKAAQPPPQHAEDADAEIQKNKTDEQREQEASARRDFMVHWIDQKFVDKEREFAVQLADPAKTTSSIVSHHFTAFERKLLYPASKKTDPELFQVQQDNRERFDELCAGRFAGKPVLLETKLAMLWFGLPVEPMKLPRRPIGFGFAFGGPEEDYENDDEDLDLMGNGLTKYEPQPLKFLNYHDNRSYGKDTWPCKSRRVLGWKAPRRPDRETPESYRDADGVCFRRLLRVEQLLHAVRPT